MKIINNKTDKIEDVRLRVGIRMIEQGKAMEVKDADSDSTALIESEEEGKLDILEVEEEPIKKKFGRKRKKKNG